MFLSRSFSDSNNMYCCLRIINTVHTSRDSFVQQMYRIESPKYTVSKKFLYPSQCNSNEIYTVQSLSSNFYLVSFDRSIFSYPSYFLFWHPNKLCQRNFNLQCDHTKLSGNSYSTVFDLKLSTGNF